MTAMIGWKRDVIVWVQTSATMTSIWLFVVAPTHETGSITSKGCYDAANWDEESQGSLQFFNLPMPSDSILQGATNFFGDFNASNVDCPLPNCPDFNGPEARVECNVSYFIVSPALSKISESSSFIEEILRDTLDIEGAAKGLPNKATVQNEQEGFGSPTVTMRAFEVIHGRIKLIEACLYRRCTIVMVKSDMLKQQLNSYNALNVV
ncbi:hypothetical protein ACLOJK_007193 [Asimina triloba]